MKELKRVSFEGPLTFDEAVRKADEDLANGAAMSFVVNGRTGDVVEITPPEGSSGGKPAGYSAAYSAGWDAMMARRARAQNGQRTTDD